VGNTKRMTELRKQEQDGTYEGICEYDFANRLRYHTYTFAKCTGGPLALAFACARASLACEYGTHAPTQGASTDARCDSSPTSPADLVPLALVDGAPHTIGHFLHAHLPLLFLSYKTVPYHHHHLLPTHTRVTLRPSVRRPSPLGVGRRVHDRHGRVDECLYGYLKAKCVVAGVEWVSRMQVGRLFELGGRGGFGRR